MVTTRAQPKRDDVASKSEEQIVEPDTQSQQEGTDGSLIVEAPTEQARENTTEREAAKQRAVPTEVANETTLPVALGKGGRNYRMQPFVNAVY